MPRRVASPVATQDEIEADQEPGPSQHDSVQDADQEMEEVAPEQKPLARSKRANGTKKSAAKVKPEKNSRSRARRDVQEADEDPEGVPFDRDEFLATARPVSDESAGKIGGLSADWVGLRHQVQTVGFPLVMDTAVHVAEISGNNEDGQKRLNELDAIMRKLIDAESEFTAHAQSLEDLEKRVASGEIIGSLEDAYVAHESETVEAYRGLTSRQKYAKHKDYTKFRDRVWEAHHDDAMPPINDLIPREDGDSDAESDIEIGGVTQDYKCPLTLTDLKDPLTSKLCRHSFSASAIRDYLKSAGRAGRKACPASGCSAMLSLADLEPDKELAERAAAAARRAKRREEESDSEGDIVD